MNDRAATWGQAQSKIIELYQDGAWDILKAEELRAAYIDSLHRGKVTARLRTALAHIETTRAEALSIMNEKTK